MPDYGLGRLPNEDEYGLGRLPSEDERDELFPMQAVATEAKDKVDEIRTYRYWWAEGWWGDQGQTPQCVSYAWLHFLEDGPITQAPRKAGAGPLYNPRWLYCKAQQIDEWVGDCANHRYDGTSVRAGAKVLQSLGVIGSYHWTLDIETVAETVLYKGPVVVGTMWYSDMFRPDEEGFVHISGTRSGGHAYLLNGVNTKRGVFRIKNSWGPGWGLEGRAYISFEDMDRLIRSNGEACVATEMKADELG